MKFSLGLLSSIALAAAQNILLTNDDGWASTGIRAAYRSLTDAGYNVILVAPVEQRSGYGGTFMYSYTNTLLHDDQFHYKLQGDDAWGSEEDDDHIWYFNATPAACVSFAFDYLIPNYFADLDIDLVVAGPNQGLNEDDTMYTLSGTVGATYNAVYRGYPAVAFSGSQTNNSFFKDSLNNDTNDPQNIYASKMVELVDTLFDNQGDNAALLPLSVGLNVNMPKVSTQSSTNCTDPKFVFSRLTGQDVLIPGLAYNSTSNLFAWEYKNGTAATANGLHGDVTLPSEDTVLASGCYSSLSAFSIDYTAPTLEQQKVKVLVSDLLSEL